MALTCTATTTTLAIPSLVELCFQSISENLEYNSNAIKVLPIDLTERLIAFMVDRLHPRHLVMTQTRAIKIRLIKQKRSCTFRFLLHGTVAQAIQQIYEKTEVDGGLDVKQYGLFQPAGAFRRARWLQEDKTLSYYDVDPSVCAGVLSYAHTLNPRHSSLFFLVNAFLYFLLPSPLFRA